MESIHPEALTVLNMYASNYRASKHVKQRMDKTERKIGQTDNYSCRFQHPTQLLLGQVDKIQGHRRFEHHYQPI